MMLTYLTGALLRICHLWATVFAIGAVVVIPILRTPEWVSLGMVVASIVLTCCEQRLTTLLLAAYINDAEDESK